MPGEVQNRYNEKRLYHEGDQTGQNGLSSEVVGALYLSVFKRQLDNALSHVL